jgi:tRNA-2-methylthio-N6-dimethylallyladenosine synthase
MNRQHDLARYRSVVADIRRLLPDATLFTDIIVGFSGESEDQYAATRAALVEFGFNMAYIATYSPRPGAASAEWPDDIPLETKKARLHDLTDVFKSSSLAWNQALVGRTIDALVESADPTGRWLQARTEGRIPVRVPVPEGLADPQSLVGRFILVNVTQARPLSLAGVWASPAADKP